MSHKDFDAPTDPVPHQGLPLAEWEQIHAWVLEQAVRLTEEEDTRQQHNAQWKKEHPQQWEKLQEWAVEQIVATLDMAHSFNYAEGTAILERAASRWQMANEQREVNRQFVRQHIQQGNHLDRLLDDSKEL